MYLVGYPAYSSDHGDDQHCIEATGELWRAML